VGCRTAGGQVQQKVCTGNAVVKPGKLYVVQAQIGHALKSNFQKEVPLLMHDG